ncbi:MAG: hypothetical protein JWO38_7971 [Gemmataceae bacterium]|nr:hypothetical protein [Gemmataceae bacterium]
MTHRIPFVVAAVLVGVVSATAADGDRQLKVVSSKALPAIESVVIYPAGAVKPGKDRPKPILTVTKFGEPVTLPGDGPVDVYAKPKGGVEVLAAGKLAVKAGPAHELKLGDVLGVVEVLQTDDSPRAEKIVVTAADDPGPDEKGHVAVQVGSDYRTEMAVPEGFYAVWVVPASGARAQRVADRIRVLPGRTTRVGGE